MTATLTLTALFARSFTIKEELACGLCIPYRCSCPASSAEVADGVEAPPMRSLRARHVRTAPAVHSSPTHHEKGFVASLFQWPRGAATASPSATGVSAAPAPVTPSTLTVAPKRHTTLQQPNSSAAAAVAAAEKRRNASTAAACPRCHKSSPSLWSATTPGCRQCQVITPEELARHKTPDSGMWLCISGVVYDVTLFSRHHPGGLLPLLDTAGSDCTDVFKVFHSRDVIEKRLPSYRLGMMGEVDQQGKIINLDAWQETPLQKDFHEMIRQLEAGGYYRTDFLWYAKKVGCLATLLFFVVLLIYWAAKPPAVATTTTPAGGTISTLNPVWYYVASSVLLGFFWQQLAFMGHDLGHNSVRGTVARDWLPGLLVTTFFGVSVQWWKRNHNVHHVVTNSLEHDPDIQYLPVFAVSEKMLDGYWSSYHDRQFPFDGVAKLLVRIQHLLYWPVMAIARLNLYVQSILLVWNPHKPVPHRRYEQAALITFWIWHVALLWSLPDWWTRFFYSLLSHNTAGLTHVQITLSHFAMPVVTEHYSSSSSPLCREHFLRSQFATTMDISCNEWWDWLHGGLQFQLTHHLLPRIPRHALREVREKFVKPFAHKHGLVYHEQSFWEANKAVYLRMKTAAEASACVDDSGAADKRRPQEPAMLWQFLNSDG